MTEEEYENGSHYFILAGREPVPATFREYVDWSVANGDEARRVAGTTLDNGRWVSTVFLWMDHNFGDGPPILFETMVFGPPSEERPNRLGEDLYQERYATWAEAEAGHAAAVARFS